MLHIVLTIEQVQLLLDSLHQTASYSDNPGAICELEAILDAAAEELRAG